MACACGQAIEPGVRASTAHHSTRATWKAGPREQRRLFSAPSAPRTGAPGRAAAADPGHLAGARRPAAAAATRPCPRLPHRRRWAQTEPQQPALVPHPAPPDSPGRPALLPSHSPSHCRPQSLRTIPTPRRPPPLPATHAGLSPLGPSVPPGLQAWVWAPWERSQTLPCACLPRRSRGSPGPRQQPAATCLPPPAPDPAPQCAETGVRLLSPVLPWPVLAWAPPAHSQQPRQPAHPRSPRSRPQALA